HHIGDVAAVVPEAEPAAGKDALRPVYSHNEMEPAEKVDEEIACDTSTVIAVVAPPEKADWFEGNFWGISEEAIPIDVRWGGFRRNRILPSALRRVAVGPGLDHVDGPNPT